MKAILKVPRGVFFDKVRWDHAMNTALDMVAENIRIDFQTTTRTWKGRPPFYIINKDDFTRFIGTDSDIYRFVSRGTRIRYATMSGDFMPKTRVGYIGSNKGRGGVAYISMMNPRPGIKARNFEEVIEDKWTKRFPQLVQRAINVEANLIGKK